MMETSFSGSEDSFDISIHSDRSEIERMLAQEVSFSDSDNSQDLSGEMLSDEEYEGPMDFHCEMCTHFLYMDFKLVRSHKAQLERILAEPGQKGFSDKAKLHMRNCCLGFYAGLDIVVAGK